MTDEVTSAPATPDAGEGSYEQALERGYWGTVPPETPATQPTDVTGAPVQAPGAPAPVDVPISPDLPNTPHPETIAAAEGDGDDGLA